MGDDDQQLTGVNDILQALVDGNVYSWDDRGSGVRLRRPDYELSLYVIWVCWQDRAYVCQRTVFQDEATNVC
jgi:hypothetical protein